MDNAPSTVLPSAWVERLFDRLLAMYGRKFADMWGCVETSSLKAAWAKALGDLTSEEISAGLTRCLTREWPPTLPEFRLLCRAVAGYETAFVEAANRWPSRDGWSEPAIYWAAAAFGRDIKVLHYNSIKARWTDALDRARANPKPIPDPVAPEFRIDDRSGLSPEQERELSLQTAARVMANWRAINKGPAGKRLGLRRERQPGEDEQEAA